MPRLDLDAIPQSNATDYPAPYDEAVRGRWYRRLGPVAGIDDFGASHVTLAPGAVSSQRHWHEGEDEMLVMIAGEAVLVDDEGEMPLRAGDIAAFPKGDSNGHQLRNDGAEPCVFFVIGRPSESACHYPDVDMHLPAGGKGFTRKDGSAFD